MKKSELKAQLYGKSNAILFEEGNGKGVKANILGIIEVGGSVQLRLIDISRKVKQAIIDHFCVEVEGVNTMKLVVEGVLTNKETLRFSVEWEEDGEQRIRDLVIEVVVTYK